MRTQEETNDWAYFSWATKKNLTNIESFFNNLIDIIVYRFDKIKNHINNIVKLNKEMFKLLSESKIRHINLERVNRKVNQLKLIRG